MASDNEIDPTTHHLVPDHSIAEPEEFNKLLEKYNIKKEQLPKILHSDPVAQHIGARPGDVVKIIRNSETAGAALAFRLVVED